jgi:cardiolipin synthase
MARSKPHWYDDNQIELLQNGEQFFPALCAAIDAARSSVHLETYIFELDRTGLKVLEHLRGACERGLKVRVALDGFGCFATAPELKLRLSEMGAICRVYRPEPRGVSRYRIDIARLRRLHRKTAVIDGRLAFVGGINIIDDLKDVPNDGVGPRPRFDFSVRVRGPVVLDIDHAQDVLWLRLARHTRHDVHRTYQRVRDWFSRRRALRSRTIPRFQPGMRAALLLRDNILHRQTIENAYLRAMEGASKEILVANAYFFPGHRLRQVLARAAARGVRVRLLLQGRPEYFLQFRATRSMHHELLKEGIEIYEYMASYLHAKVAVIDSSATVGSSNLDPFSLLLAREANIVVQDAAFAATLQAALEAEIDANTTCVTLQSLQQRGRLERAIDAIAYFLLRVGVALTGESSRY